MRNMTVAELRAEKDKGKARDTMAADSAKELAKAERSVLEARQAVADFDRQNKVVSGSNANYRKIIVNQLAAAESNLTKVKQDQYIKSRDIQEAEGRAIAAAMVNADKVKAKMDADKKAMSGMLGGLKFDPSEVAKHASALKEAHSNELSQIEKFYNTKLSQLDKFNADAGTRLKDELSAGLIEKGEYMARELKLTEQYETQKLQLLDKERAAYEAIREWVSHLFDFQRTGHTADDVMASWFARVGAMKLAAGVFVHTKAEQMSPPPPELVSQQTHGNAPTTAGIFEEMPAHIRAQLGL
jgi:hypothetical protein